MDRGVEGCGGVGVQAGGRGGGGGVDEEGWITIYSDVFLCSYYFLFIVLLCSDAYHKNKTGSETKIDELWPGYV